MADTDLGLRHLRVLSLLLEVRSLTAAARLLGTTQSSVSKVLVKLRKHFGDPLFVRVGLAMEPTPKALALAEPLRGLLAGSDAMRAATLPFEPELSTREFAVLLTDVGMIRFVPPLMAHFDAVGRSLKIRALPLDSRPLRTRLESGEADVALGDFPAATPTLRRQHLYDDGFVSVARRDHPRLEELAAAAGFLRERHVMVMSSPTGHAAHQSVEQALLAAIDPALVHGRVPSFLIAALVASRGDAVATMPATLAAYLADDLRLACFRPPLRLPAIEISQFWHERVHEDRGHRWFRGVIFTLFGGSGEGRQG